MNNWLATHQRQLRRAFTIVLYGSVTVLAGLLLVRLLSPSPPPDWIGNVATGALYTLIAAYFLRYSHDKNVAGMRAKQGKPYAHTPSRAGSAVHTIIAAVLIGVLILGCLYIALLAALFRG